MLNGTMMQYFHWYSNGDGTFWKDLESRAQSLSEQGITALWLPPAYKGQSGTYDVGYGVYDLYDLGEFNQKGSVRTKYGTKDEYIQAISKLQENKIQVYADTVLNHRLGADEVESCVSAVPVDWNDRNRETTGAKWIKPWTRFNFDGRNNKYSNFKLSSIHFSGVDYDDWTKQSRIFKFHQRGPGWEWEVSYEKGNYDFLMGADVDFQNPGVVDELKNWVKWYFDVTSINGLRLDALKHIRFSFIRDYVDYINKLGLGKDLFFVGEYVPSNRENSDELHYYIAKTEGKVSLFDFVLQNNFHKASKSFNNYDMRSILDNTLTKEQPTLSVSFVENHDTQPLQALENTVDPWFKPLAYSIILLRQEGYPCVFYTDYFGANYKDKGRDGNYYDIYMPAIPGLKEMLAARKLYAYGNQHDYFDHPNTIGWTREGIDEIQDSGLAVLMTNGETGYKWMYIGEKHAGKTFMDYLGNVQNRITINQYGWANFKCNAGSVSVWVQE